MFATGCPHVKQALVDMPMKVSIASLMCFLGLSVVATAQESIYSANSLMAAFDKGANVKGAQISFRDVVVDNKNSKVTFRSS